MFQQWVVHLYVRFVGVGLCLCLDDCEGRPRVSCISAGRVERKHAWGEVCLSLNLGVSTDQRTADWTWG